MRIILITGKGGVGKTSIASATAVRMAQSGRKVLVLSTDLAHSLGDSLGKTLSGEAAPVQENLYALEVDPILEGKKAWTRLYDYLVRIMTLRYSREIEMEEALLFPGLEELFSLLCILDIYEQQKYDVLIVDCAPSGETLSLLRYPDRLSVLTDRLLPDIRRITKILGPAIARKTAVPKPEDEVFTEFETLVNKLHRLQNLLRNKEVTSLRLVMTPERIVLDEAGRTYMQLQNLEFPVDAVYINKIYPEEALEGYFSEWRTLQEENIHLIRKRFSGQKIFALALQDGELNGLPALQRAAEEIYGDMPPERIFHGENPFAGSSGT